jgi:hypothetical protein
MSPLPATSTASGPNKKTRSGRPGLFDDWATYYTKKGPSGTASRRQNDQEAPLFALADIA